MIRKGYEIYEAYVDGHKQEMSEGQPFVVEVRDLETFTRMIVKAIISRKKDGIEGGSTLWFKDFRDEIVPHPGSIKIIEELDDDQFEAVKSSKYEKIKTRGGRIGSAKLEVDEE